MCITRPLQRMGFLISFGPMLPFDTYEIVIGLEVHAQLLTKTKLFCADTTNFGLSPNTQVSAVSLGHPGTLPFLNRSAIELAVKLGLACGCEIVQHNYFARKNYFYPDLPKGYQISQHTTPICRGGFVEIETKSGSRSIPLNRIHIEEDAGKSIHDETGDWSNLDYNRAGMPLLEIVTEPGIRSAEEASSYVTNLRQLVRHLDVCDGNMQEGSLRCDVNISVRKKGDDRLGTKVEIKNLNSIRFIRKAIEHEAARLIAMHSNQQPIIQETRGFDEHSGTTYPIRVKEDEDDYRYFPEPDLPPFFISNEEIEKIRISLPPTPVNIKIALMTDYGLGDYDAMLLANNGFLLKLFKDIAANYTNYKAIANWVIGPVQGHLQKDEDTEPGMINTITLAHLITLTDDNRITHGIATQQVLPALIKDYHLDLDEFISQNDLYINNSQREVDELIERALQKHAQKIPEYKKGKKGLLSLFVGEVMKLSKGKVDAQMITKKIIDKLNSGS